MTDTSTTQDPRPLFATALATATDVIDGVQPADLARPTPCTEMDVDDVLGHLVGVVRRVAMLGRGEDFANTRLEVDFDDVETLRTGWADAVADAKRSWATDASLTRPVRLPWAQGSGAEALSGYLNELTVHTWDLAAATGQEPHWDGDVLSVAFESIRQVLPGEGRTALFEAVAKQMPREAQPMSPPFAERVVVSDDAPAIDHLVAWNGRSPSWRPTVAA